MYKLAVVNYGFMKDIECFRRILDRLVERGVSIDFVDVARYVSDRELADLLGGYNFIITSTRPYYGAEFFRLNRCLTLIARHGIGVDNIDLDAAAREGIYVIRVPNRVERDSVAEHTIALMLASLRRINIADRYVRSGRVEISRYDSDLVRSVAPPKDLSSMTVGIVGFGNIGSRVAEILAKGFNARIVVYDPYVDPERVKALNAEIVDSLKKLFATCDIVSIHVPLTSETRGMIDREVLSVAKRGLILVNTARGEIIDTDSLIWAIENGIVSYAGLDVFEEEPLPRDHRLLKMDKVVLTPHIGAMVYSTQARMLESIVGAIISYLDGRDISSHAVVEVEPSSPRKLSIC